MKQILLPLVFMLMPVVASAQQSAHPQVSAPVEQSLRFGYFSYEEVLHTMPGYAIAKHNMDDLRAKYDAETKRAEDEFNAKYEEFLDGQRSFAPSILEKRQAELRELMAKNVTFKAEAVRLARAGVSMRAIGRRMGVDRKAVRAALVEAGLIVDEASDDS